MAGTSQMNAKLDETDRRILRELQRDGALRNDELAERIGLSPSPTLRRVRALEERGLLRYIALVDPQKVGLGVRMRVDIRLTEQDRAALERFDTAILAMPEVLECMTMLGEWDYSLTVVAHDVEDYQRFLLDRLAKLPNIANYRSTLVVKEVKRTTALPI
jgi:Lrp/AsnC family transcriptional regulator, leucine-responsive regulatory protein